MQTLKYILILVCLVAGAFVPLFWFGLLLVFFDEKKKVDDCNARHSPTPTSDSRTSYGIHNAVPASFESRIYIDPTTKRDYMKSIEWDTIRKAVLRRDDYECQSCGEFNIPLDVHHLHYKNFTRESTDDLVSLCRHCHDAVHNKYGYDHNDHFPIGA